MQQWHKKPRSYYDWEAREMLRDLPGDPRAGDRKENKPAFLSGFEK
jgi:hypothetical protein